MTTSATAQIHHRVGLEAGRFHRALRAVFEQALEPHGLAPAEYGALAVIADEPGVTNAALARVLSVSPQATGELVLKLVERGLLRREPHPTIGRGLATQLTPQGRTVLVAARRAMTRAEDRLLAPLSDDESSALLTALQRCADGVL